MTVEYLEQGRIGYKIQGPGQVRIKDKRFCPVDLLAAHEIVSQLGIEDDEPSSKHQPVHSCLDR